MRWTVHPCRSRSVMTAISKNPVEYDALAISSTCTGDCVFTTMIMCGVRTLNNMRQHED